VSVCELILVGGVHQEKKKKPEAAEMTEDGEVEFDDSCNEEVRMLSEDSPTREGSVVVASSAADDNYEHLMQLAGSMETHSSSTNAADSNS